MGLRRDEFMGRPVVVILNTWSELSQTAEEARRAVAAVHGASRYRRDTDYLQRANDRGCVILQLETRAAVAGIAEIAAVTGVDALFVGPGDLAGDMDHVGAVAHPDMQAALREAAGAVRALGIPVGIVGPTVAMVRDFTEWATVSPPWPPTWV